MTLADHSPRCRFALSIVQQLRAAGFQALFAGGCVRDQLLGKTPKDYDVATSASPDQVMDLIGRHKTVPVGAAFGVVMVPGSHPSEGAVEVATFRSDGQYIDGRRPSSVRFCSPAEDAQRRDFTINGMFFDPLENQVLDYVGGQADLQQQVVRAIGDPVARFSEDKLRLLRAVRFTTTFRFRLEPATELAVRAACHQINQVSVERITQELRRMLAHPERAQACRLLLQTGLLYAILPELMNTAGTETLPPADLHARFHMLQHLQAESAEAAWAILLQPLLKPAAADQHNSLTTVDSLLKRLKMSNQEIAEITWLIAHRTALTGLPQQPLHFIKPLLAHPCSHLLLAVTEATHASQNSNSEDARFARNFLASHSTAQLDPPPLISGNDVIARGIPPGPRIRTLLESIRNAQLDQLITTREEALQLLQQQIAR